MKKVILIFLQKVPTKDTPLGVWQFSSHERKPISLFGEQVAGVSFRESIPGTVAGTNGTTVIYTAWLNAYNDTIAQQVKDSNGSERFYLIMEEDGSQAVVTEEQGLAVHKEQMQGTSIPQQPQAVAE